MSLDFEQGPIRPPSEAESLLVRITRNCPWNKCLFCPVYKKKKFSRRGLEEVKEDISAMKKAADKIYDTASEMGYKEVNRNVLEKVYKENPDLLQIAFWLFRGGKNVFLQDADSLVMPTEQLSEAISYLKEQFPTIERITTYSRSKTVSRRSVEELKMLKEAGLTRVHIGMETGHDPLLEYMRKGVTSEQHVEAGLKVKEADLSLSEYVLLGLGGKEMWKEHAINTADVLNRIDPHFIRIRTLAVRKGIPLKENIASGEFQMQDDEGTVMEERLLVENLDCHSYFVSDHILNLLEEVEGQLPGDKNAMLSVIDDYLSMPSDKRMNYRLGRRLGLYRYLRDMNIIERYNQVEDIRRQVQEKGMDEEEFLNQYISQYV